MPRPYDAIDHLQAAAERAGRKHELILETLQAADEAEAERWAAEIMARPCRSRSDGTPPLSDEWSEQMAGFAKVEAEYSPMGRVS